VHELISPPVDGRVFSEDLRPGLADCAPSGRIRLDALARWLQDVAYADVDDAGVAQSAVWVVRRARMCVKRFPRFGERFRLSTFCSGLGRMWAERRTTIARPDADESDVEAVAVWVHLNSSGRPTPLTPRELEIYGSAAAGRRVTARLRHPAPSSPERRWPWTFRATDCDLADHVNNAAYWQPLEEELLAGADPEHIDVEIEYRVPAQPGAKVILCEGERRWIADEGGEVNASILVRPQRS
jgi:acyl-ACP thioesterase